MLKKLIKYDFHSCFKTFWPIWLGIFVISILNGISLAYCSKYDDYSFVANDLPKLLLFGVAIAACVIALIYIYKEFSYGLLGDQGYLMFTLPAKEEELIMSKAITALIMEAISAVVVVICVTIMATISTPMYMAYIFKDTFRVLANTDWFLFSVLIFEGILVLAATAMTINFHIYTASAIGHLSKKKRILIFVVVYVLICILSATISTNVVIPIIENILENRIYISWRTDMYETMGILGIIIVAELIYTAIMFFITRYIVKNKICLE